MFRQGELDRESESSLARPLGGANLQQSTLRSLGLDPSSVLSGARAGDHPRPEVSASSQTLGSVSDADRAVMEATGVGVAVVRPWGRRRHRKYASFLSVWF